MAEHLAYLEEATCHAALQKSFNTGTAVWGFATSFTIKGFGLMTSWAIPIQHWIKIEAVQIGNEQLVNIVKQSSAFEFLR